MVIMLKLEKVLITVRRSWNFLPNIPKTSHVIYVVWD